MEDHDRELGARTLEVLTSMTDRRIFAALDSGARTVAQLRPSVPNVSEEVLSEHLDRLEADGYVRRLEPPDALLS
ncbi:MAG TPA: winged helix-turn-helix transcriptional regulator [Solirubrobacteraceae bacterium]